MLFSSLSILAVSLSSCVDSVLAASLEKRAPAPFSEFTRNIFYRPGADYVRDGTLYARSLQLPDDSILMTWENYSKEPPLVYYGGATWYNYSTIHDQVNGWGLRYQPFLYTLPIPMGGLPAGTILAAGNSIPTSLSGGMKIDLYYSLNQGLTWHFKSNIASGPGPAGVADGDLAIWEPFLLTHNGQLVVYYSDSTDTAHSQKLVHTTTTDLCHWSPVVNDQVDPGYHGRPGMTTISHIESTNKYFMSFEACVTDGCRVHYKIADDPLSFDKVPAVQLKTTTNGTASSGPFAIWTRDYTKTDGSGLIILSATSNEGLYINSDDAPAGQWKLIPTGQYSAYTRNLRIIDVLGKKKLFIGSGGNLGQRTNNAVSCAVLKIPTLS